MFKPNEVHEMKSEKGLMSNMYWPIAMLGKYSGILQIPDGYCGSANRGLFKKIIFKYILPVLSLSFQMLYIYGVMYSAYMAYRIGVKVGFDCLINVISSVGGIMLGPLVASYYYFKTSTLLFVYLKKLKGIDILLRPTKSQLRRYAKVGIVLTVILSLIRISIFTYVKWVQDSRFQLKISHWYFPKPINVMCFGMYIGMLVISCADGHPQFTYIYFHHVLHTAFEQLLSDIQIQGQLQTLETRELAERVRTYLKQFQQLCHLSKQLDTLFSPIILFNFVVIGIVCGLGIILFPAQIIGKRPGYIGTVAVYLILVIIRMLWATIFSFKAHKTGRLASQVLPALMSAFKIKSKQMKEEVEMISLFAICNKISFSASGLFAINRATIPMLITTIISYAMVAVEILYGRKNIIFG